jgi:tetratricopeptide (TPR) repeat protein
VPIAAIKALVAQGRYLQADRDAQRMIASGDLGIIELADAFLYLSIAKFHLQEFWGSMKLAERALAIPEATPETVGMAALMVGLNGIETGDISIATEHLERAMEILSTTPALKQQEGVIHHNLALANRARRDWEKANMHFEWAAHIFAKTGEMAKALDCYRGAAWCYLIQEEVDRAELLTGKIEAYVRDHANVDPRWYTILLVDKAFAYLCRGQYGEAIAFCEEVSAPGRVGVSDEQKTEACWIAGEAAFRLGHLDQAALFADYTIDWALKVQWPYMMNKGNDLRRRVMIQRGHSDAVS